MAYQDSANLGYDSDPGHVFLHVLCADIKQNSCESVMGLDNDSRCWPDGRLKLDKCLLYDRAGSKHGLQRTGVWD